MSNSKVQDVKDTILVTQVSYLNNYYIPEYEKRPVPHYLASGAEYSNLDKFEGMPVKYVVIKLKTSGQAHDGYCSDPGEYFKYDEEYSYIKFPLLIFTQEFISTNFVNNNYIGTTNDIITYLNSQKCMRGGNLLIIAPLKTIDKQCHGSSYCGSCYCDATSYTELVSISVKTIDTSSHDNTPRYTFNLKFHKCFHNL